MRVSLRLGLIASLGFLVSCGTEVISSTQNNISVSPQASECVRNLINAIDTIKTHPQRAAKQFEPIQDTETKACLYFEELDAVIDIPKNRWCNEQGFCNLDLTTSSDIQLRGEDLRFAQKYKQGDQITAHLVLMELGRTQNCPTARPLFTIEDQCNWSFTQTSTSRRNCTSRLQLTYEVQEGGQLKAIEHTPDLYLSGYFDEELQNFDTSPISQICPDAQVNTEGCSGRSFATAEINLHSDNHSIIAPFNNQICNPDEVCSFTSRPGRKMRLISHNAAANECLALGCARDVTNLGGNTDCVIRFSRCENTVHQPGLFNAQVFDVTPQVQIRYNAPDNLLKNISTMIDNELVCGPSVNSCKNPQIVSVDGKCNQDITIEQSINSDDLQFVDTTTPKGTTTANPFTHTVEPSFEQNILTANFNFKARLEIVPASESNNFCSGSISVSSGVAPEDKMEGTCGETCGFDLDRPTVFTLELSNPTQGIRWFQKLANRQEQELAHCRNNSVCPLGEVSESTQIRLEQLNRVTIEPTLDTVDNLFSVNGSPYSSTQNQFDIPCRSPVTFNISDEQSTELNTNNIHFTSWGANGVCPADSSCTLNPNTSLTVRPVFYEVRPLRLTFGNRHLPPQNEAITVEYTSPRPATIRPINSDFDRTSCTRDDGTCTIYIRVVDQTTETLEPVTLVVSDSIDQPPPLQQDDAGEPDTGVDATLDLRPFSRWYSVAEDCRSDRDNDNLAKQKRLRLPSTDLPACLGVAYSYYLLLRITYLIPSTPDNQISNVPPENIPPARLQVSFENGSTEIVNSEETVAIAPDEPYTVSILHPSEGPPIWEVVRWKMDVLECSTGPICSLTGGSPTSNVLVVQLRAIN